MTHRRTLSFALLLNALLVAPALAQEEERAEQPTLVYKPVTEIDFGTLEIEAELVRPSITLISDIKRESFNFITLRSDWNQEIQDSVNTVR